MASAFMMDRGIIILGLDMIDLGKFQEQDLVCGLDDEAIRPRALGVLKPCLGARNGAMKARVIERFEEIVQSAGIEGAQRIMIVSGDENNGRRKRRAQALQNIEAIAFGHLNIEKDQIGALVANDRDGVCARSALRDDL